MGERILFLHAYRESHDSAPFNSVLGLSCVYVRETILVVWPRTKGEHMII